MKKYARFMSGKSLSSKEEQQNACHMFTLPQSRTWHIHPHRLPPPASRLYSHHLQQHTTASVDDCTWHGAPEADLVASASQRPAIGPSQHHQRRSHSLPHDLGSAMNRTRGKRCSQSGACREAAGLCVTSSPGCTFFSVASPSKHTLQQHACNAAASCW